MSGDIIEADGIVRDFQHAIAHVDVQIGGQTRRVLAKRCGKMAKARVYLLPGDRVRVELSPYDLERGRVAYRYDRGARP